MRLKRGFSQESFADECEIHRTYMGAIERGERNVTVGTLRAVAHALRVKLSAMLKGF